MGGIQSFVWAIFLFYVALAESRRIYLQSCLTINSRAFLCGEYPGAVVVRLVWQVDGILIPVTISSIAADRYEKRFFSVSASHPGIYHTVFISQTNACLALVPAWKMLLPTLVDYSRFSTPRVGWMTLLFFCDTQPVDSVRRSLECREVLPAQSCLTCDTVQLLSFA